MSQLSRAADFYYQRLVQSEVGAIARAIVPGAASVATGLTAEFPRAGVRFIALALAAPILAAESPPADDS